MQIELVRVHEDRKAVIAQLMELYNYDFSEFDQEDVDINGKYGYAYLDHYWIEENRHPFFIEVDENYAGFVLINQHLFAATEVGTKSIAEFFVMRKYRRQGIGKQVVHKVLDMFPGKWELSYYDYNEPAKLFWNKVIKDYTSDKYCIQHIIVDDIARSVLLFESIN